MQFKRIKRHVNGVLLLDKPLGISSNQALQIVKRHYQAAKAGHTGSLDPLATGLLPICLGEATKFSHFLLDADKSYRALVRLGSTTTTGDAEGAVLSTAEVDVSLLQIEQVLLKFTGEIEQVPPMYSALKHQGKALYEYARDGVEIERPARRITIHGIRLEKFDIDAGVLEIVVSCSKGTYIRTLAEDIGCALGCGAHLGGLRRLSTAHFQLQDAFTLEQLEAMSAEARDDILLSPDAAVADMQVVKLDDDSAFYLLQGQAVWKPNTRIDGLFRIYRESGEFLGLGEQDASGKIAPKRLVVIKA
ncbi:tRNA pseudouridine(55) synthase TruB [Methylobacillus gramineus]|uniref:tRNA pseudouridine(55) synthase TruB n=1 Tax=Methylobacillus gramineus TaxID=755169 RepID=UPI001CFF7EB8|nr:tRNA pseudouridine(55) synthase TruB [Methylobacillus gramineus]MCB5185432.1 tRNA pseudouridine(55) synthase TruB [Methylobacillus gramineus]